MTMGKWAALPLAVLLALSPAWPGPRPGAT